MFGKFFNSGDDKEEPSLPEVRQIPDFAKNIQTPDEKWITSQVFSVSSKGKDFRMYYAAHLLPGRDDAWTINQYSYSASRGGSLRDSVRDAVFKADEAIKRIIELQKASIEYYGHDVYAIPDLKGNYRAVANLHSAHFDDNDNYISISKDTPVTGEALFSRKNLNALYNSKAKNEPVPPVVTWDDFYREVVYQVGVESSKPRANRKAAVLAEAERFHQKMADNRLSLGEKNEAIYQFSLPRADAGYHEKVFRLTRIMRVGADMYDQVVASGFTDPEKIQLLGDIGAEIKKIAQQRLNFSPQRANEIADLIMQGPDPYAELDNPAPEKQPKPYSP